MKFIKSIAITAALLATSVSASQIEVDLNDGGLTPTGSMDYITVNYDSHTTVNGLTGAVTTIGGVNAIGVDFGFLAAPVVADFGSLVGCVGVSFCGTSNTISGVPDYLAFGGSSEYVTSGLALTYGLSLTGFLVGGELMYTGGTLDMYSYDLSSAGNVGYVPDMLFTSEFTAGGVFAGQQVVQTTITDVTAAGQDTFFLSDYDMSFEDFMDVYLDDIRLYVVQTVDAADLANRINAAFLDDDLNDGQGTAYITAPHNASVVFDVPEPTSLAILGLGLLGLASTKRRKS